MRNKPFILSEIRRTAEANGGKPLGQRAFLTATGIEVHEWLGVHCARWADALLEAGFEPLEWTSAVDEQKIYDVLIPLIRKYRRYPTKAVILIEKKSNSQIPAPNVMLRRFGERANIIQKIRDFCANGESYADARAILANEPASTKSKPSIHAPGKEGGKQRPSGYVYLVKSGKLHKIGLAADNPFRRKSELHRQTSEGIEDVHTISAIDDAPGIERYWHERFKEKRQHCEWFDLSAEDVRAFKKRKFM